MDGGHFRLGVFPSPQNHPTTDILSTPSATKISYIFRIVIRTGLTFGVLIYLHDFVALLLPVLPGVNLKVKF